MLYFILILSILFLFHSNNLLLSLLILEIMSFMVMFYMSYTLSVCMPSDFLILAFFSVFVMEGVMALSGLIMFVSFTGSDYISSSSLTKF